MKAIIPVMPPDVIALRRTNGSDQWDEMWEGVLHVPPMPNFFHQDLGGEIHGFLRQNWAKPQRAKVLLEINLCKIGVEDWTKDYRVPDLLLMKPDRFHINKITHFEGAPNVVVEIRSAGDETYEKLDFYRELGVPEVWVIDRDSKQPEIYLLRNRRFRKAVPNAGGWIYSPETGVEMKPAPENKLSLRMRGDESSLETIPT